MILILLSVIIARAPFTVASLTQCSALLSQVMYRGAPLAYCQIISGYKYHLWGRVQQHLSRDVCNRSENIYTITEMLKDCYTTTVPMIYHCFTCIAVGAHPCIVVNCEVRYSAPLHAFRTTITVTAATVARGVANAKQP